MQINYKEEIFQVTLLLIDKGLKMLFNYTVMLFSLLIYL